MKAVPKSLLDLLAQEWKPAIPNQSIFEIIFAERERAHDPSFYFASEGEPSAVDMLRFDEVTGLLRDGVLNPATAAVRRRPSGTRYTSTNEHAQHAVYDFCEAVYAAWQELQQRLTLIEQTSHVPANHEPDCCTHAQKHLVTN